MDVSNGTNNPTISRRHAKLIVEDDHLVLTDLESGNGTMIEETPLSGPSHLYEGQTARLGDVLLRALAPWTAGQGLLLEARSAALPEGRTEPGRLERLRDEMELLGFTVSGHPVELFPEVAWETYCPVGEVRGFAGERVTTCGLVVAQRVHHQSDGRAMKFISLGDRTDILEVEIFADVYRRCGGVLARWPVVEVTGRVEALGGSRGCVLRAERVRPARRGAVATRELAMA